MEQVRPICWHARRSQEPGESLDALMRAMVQAAGYLERVIAAAATWRWYCCAAQ